MMIVMNYVRLGRSGLKVSRIVLGCMTYGDPAWRDWVLDEEASRPFFRRALELGINFFDTADMYSLGRSEEITGRALKDFARREDIVLATKVAAPMGPGVNNVGLSRKHIMDAAQASLKRLGTDYIDLYQIHSRDPNTPIDETLEALHDLVKLGMVRYIGASNHFAYQIARAQYLADFKGWTRFVSVQDQYNLLYREEEREMLPLCREEGIGFLPWSPLARGYLAGNRRGGEGQTTRGSSDTLSQSAVRQPDRRSGGGRREAGGRGTRRAALTGGAGLDSAPGGRYRADHRGQQDEPPGRSGGGRGHQPERRGARATRRSVPAPRQHPFVNVRSALLRAAVTRRPA